MGICTGTPCPCGCSGTTYSIVDDFSSALSSSLWLSSSDYETSGGELKRSGSPAITATLTTQEHTFDSLQHTEVSASIDLDGTLDVGDVYLLRWIIGSGGSSVTHFIRKDIATSVTNHFFEYVDDNGSSSTQGAAIAGGVFAGNIGFDLTKTGTNGTAIVFTIEYLIDSVVVNTVTGVEFQRTDLCSCSGNVQIKRPATRADNFSLVSS